MGRAEIQRELKAHLLSSTTHPALAGPYGGGKTSLICCLLNGLRADAKSYSFGQLLLPVRGPLSPSKQEEPKKFVERCLLELSFALVDGARSIEAAGGRVGRRVQALADFIDRPLFISGGAGATVLGSGGSGTRNVAVNTGFGFQASGLDHLVREALKEAFPADECGAVVGCIDDVELWGEAEQVLQFLSDIREPLLTLQGVKWIILGANQVLQGVDSHPRLAGVVSGLKGLPALPDAEISGVVEKRIRLFQAAADVTVPVNGEAFSRIYERSGRHLRAALGHSLEFSVYADSRGILDSDELVSTEEEDDGRQWLRWDVPPEFVDGFLNQLSLGAWDELVELGAAAATVLADLAATEGMEAEVLIQGDPSRMTALARLANKRFVAGTVPGGSPVGIVQLTGSGHLAIEGGRHSGNL